MSKFYEKYNEIPTYNECLQIVKEFPAFSHSTQILDGVKIESFKYNISKKDMWDGYGHLNMRGITFVNEQLAALPFPKFFNLGEHENSTNIDLNNVSKIYEKVDGSLISVFYVGTKLYLKSMKSVNSDVSKEANKNVTEDVLSFSRTLLEKDLSPLFEYVSPESRIVLQYSKPEFYFLGCRNMITGATILPDEIDVPQNVKTPGVFKTVEEMKSYIKQNNVEGVVVTLNNGVMIKIKSEDYCRVHRIMSYFNPKNIVENIINNTYDDMIGILSYNNLNSDVEKSKVIFSRYTDRMNEFISMAESYYRENKHHSRKDIAIELKENRMLANLVFRLIDGKEITDTINKYVLEESKEWNF